MNLNFMPLTVELATTLSRERGVAWHRDRETWARYLSENAIGVRRTLIAICDDQPVGYGSLKMRSDYKPFTCAGILEIHDLAVSGPWRCRGIASRLIRESEALARTGGHTRIGLAIDLHADHGPAVRLYRKLGFVSDGLGLAAVALQFRNIQRNATGASNDNRLLWLTKILAP